MSATVEPAEILPAFFTVPEIAARLRLSRSKIYMMIESGELKSLRIGRARRIARAAVLAFEASLSGGDIAD